LGPSANSQFTCFTSTKVQVLTPLELQLFNAPVTPVGPSADSQFTCFTSTKVQVLTPLELQLFNAPVTPVGAECKCTFCEGCFTNLVQFGGRCVKCKRGLPRDPSQWERNVEVLCVLVYCHICVLIYCCICVSSCSGLPRDLTQWARKVEVLRIHYICVLVCYFIYVGCYYMCTRTLLYMSAAGGSHAFGTQC
jgi:hypothetical protein